MTSLRDQYIARVNDAETETAAAKRCIYGNILFNIAVPKNKFPTGKIACVVVEFTATDLNPVEEELVYYYDWIPYMLAIAFGRENVLPSDKEFTEPGTEDLLLSAKRKVALPRTVFVNLKGDAIDSVLHESGAIRWPDEETKALISDRAKTQSNISPAGAQDLRVYRRVADDERHLCLLTFDTSFFGHVKGGLGYLPVIAGVSGKSANHLLVAELQESPLICMFESNYRGMQSLQFDEAKAVATLSGERVRRGQPSSSKGVSSIRENQALHSSSSTPAKPNTMTVRKPGLTASSMGFLGTKRESVPSHGSSAVWPSATSTHSKRWEGLARWEPNYVR